MSRQKSMMQNITTVNADGTVQKGTDVLRVGNNRSGVVFMDVYTATGPTNTVVLQTTADDVNGSSAPTSPDVWITIVTFSNFTGATSLKVTITDLGESIRWKVTTQTAPGVTFRMIAFLTDQT